jgi:hypothetical protein
MNKFSITAAFLALIASTTLSANVNDTDVTKVAELNATIVKLNLDISSLHNSISTLEARNVQAHLGSHPLKCEVGITSAEVEISKCTIAIDHNLLRASAEARLTFDREDAINKCIKRGSIRSE